MTDTQMLDEAGGGVAYAHTLGDRLRAMRVQQKMSLTDVARKSGGKWKAVVVGSYERGDRAVSVVRLAALAHFYGVPVIELIPAPVARPVSRPAGERVPHIVLDLERLLAAPGDEAAPVLRYTRIIRRQRHDYGNQVMSLRIDDVRVLAAVYDLDIAELIEMLGSWGVLADRSMGTHPAAEMEVRNTAD
jgi:transcriptional regulator with XRE-family HTH domain